MKKKENSKEKEKEKERNRLVPSVSIKKTKNLNKKGFLFIFFILVLIILILIGITKGSKEKDEIIERLVEDFIKVTHGENPSYFKSDISTIAVRKRKELNDLYQFFFQEEARKQNGKRKSSTHSIEEKVGVVSMNFSLKFEEILFKKMRTFIATETTFENLDLKNFVEEMRTLDSKFKKVSELNSVRYNPIQVIESLRPKYLINRSSIQKFFDPMYLPRYQEIVDLFPWLSSSYEPVVVPNHNNLDSITSPYYNQFITPDNFIYFTTNEAFFQCEIFTYEYIYSFSKYLHERITIIFDKQKLMPQAHQGIVILELGAGNGRLSYFLFHFLTQVFHFSKDKLTIIATDKEGSNGVQSGSFDVVKVDHITALKKFNPDLVISSWMSKENDWTEEIRKHQRVQEYILIGEIDYGSSGIPSKTWGLPSSKEASRGQKIPILFEKDNFKRFTLEDLSLIQISRSDTPLVKFHSHTVSFRRQKLETV